VTADHLGMVERCPRRDRLHERQGNIVGKGKWQVSWPAKTQSVVFGPSTAIFGLMKWS